MLLMPYFHCLFVPVQSLLFFQNRNTLEKLICSTFPLCLPVCLTKFLIYFRLFIMAFLTLCSAATKFI